MHKKTIQLLSGVACAAVFAAGQAVAAEPKSCADVRMATPGWADIDSTNAMAGLVLEALGYRQSVQNLSVPITYQGLQKGQLDVFLGNWMPAQKPMVDPLVQKKAVEVVVANLANAKFTLAVPSYVAEAGIKRFADLANHGDKFNKTIYGIEPGAPANQNIDRMIKAKDFGLGDWKLVESGEAAMLTQVARNARDQKWVVFLGWEPHLMNTKFKLNYLEGGDAYFGPNYGAATVYTVTRPGYAKECPNVGRLFSQMKFSVDLENEIIAAYIGEKIEVKTAARDALRKHPELVKAWLDGVTTASGGDGLSAVRQALGI